mmetsp:Transcript_28158/g.81407  ORF Transcript_28158/g.81407 Transcript_28158/m.81407 type:complete len:239 (-) Transcript_28158:7-723(-)
MTLSLPLLPFLERLFRDGCALLARCLECFNLLLALHLNLILERRHVVRILLQLFLHLLGIHLEHHLHRSGGALLLVVGIVIPALSLDGALELRRSRLLHGQQCLPEERVLLILQGLLPRLGRHLGLLSIFLGLALLGITAVVHTFLHALNLLLHLLTLVFVFETKGLILHHFVLLLLSGLLALGRGLLLGFGRHYSNTVYATIILFRLRSHAMRSRQPTHNSHQTTANGGSAKKEVRT